MPRVLIIMYIDIFIIYVRSLQGDVVYEPI